MTQRRRLRDGTSGRVPSRRDRVKSPREPMGVCANRPHFRPTRAHGARDVIGIRLNAAGVLSAVRSRAAMNRMINPWSSGVKGRLNPRDRSMCSTAVLWVPSPRNSVPSRGASHRPTRPQPPGYHWPPGGHEHARRSENDCAPEDRPGRPMAPARTARVEATHLLERLGL